jgi:hypothetical protein
VNNLNRRRLFKIAGVGSALAAGAALPVVGRLVTESSGDSDAFAFRSSLGLPERPLPSYATYLVEGTLNLAAGTGLITSRVLAGHPDDPSEVGLPGLARIIKVTQVQANGAVLNVRGIIEDRSQLQPGESAQVDLVIDRARRTVVAPFGARALTLAMS